MASRGAHPTPQPWRPVFVIMEPAVAGDLIRGVRRFAEPHRRWQIEVRVPRVRHLPGLPALRPDGVIAVAVSTDFATAVAKLPLPLVVVGGDYLPGTAWLGFRPEDIVSAAIAHLAARGFRHVAFLGCDDSAGSHGLCAAFVAAARGIGATCAVRQLAHGLSLHANVESVAELRRWLAELPKPCGILAADDGLAHLLGDVCLMAEIPVPEQVALLGIGDHRLACELARPQLSSVALPWEQLGYEAAALLEVMMRGGGVPRGPLHLDVGPVVVRGSTDLAACEDELVARTVRFLTEHAGRRLTIAAVARQIGVSHRTLELRFRETLRRTPLQELTRIRMERAKALLADPRLSIAAVARRVGFADPVWFSSRFRRFAGTTPMRYRAQLASRTPPR